MIGPKAAGVILTMVAEFYGSWADIDKAADGRSVGANIFFEDDTTARINTVYGVSGASNPNFTSFTSKHTAEGMVNDYIIEQSKTCDHKGYHMVVAGDVNS